MTEASSAVSSPVDLPKVGSLIAGKFRLEELIGEGGQAFVWKARHLELDAEVALKILRNASKDPTQIERLRKEARAVVKLNHPAIVRVFDLGETPQGDPYFVMEHLEGENLADCLARSGKMDPIEAVRLLLPIAGAVAAVHAIGVVHRDLKPDNVFLARSAHAVQPKLLDFGVAKHDAMLTRQLKLTEVGTVLGSPAYLSPEQARGQADIDGRADVWSFCTMLYECVSGVVPFQAANTHALLFSIAEDEPPTLAAQGVDEEGLWKILRRGLEKAPQDRWPNMRTLGRALAQWLVERGVSSDISGVTLDSIWFNPDIVTQPPLEANRAHNMPSDAPAWTMRTDAESHIETKGPESVIRVSQDLRWRSALLTLTFLSSMGVAIGGLTGTTRGVQALAHIPRYGKFIALHLGEAPESARPWPWLGVAPTSLSPKVTQALGARTYPNSPDDLLPLPVVPVEKLKLVGSAQAQIRRATVPHGVVVPASLTLTSSPSVAMTATPSAAVPNGTAPAPGQPPPTKNSP